MRVLLSNKSTSNGSLEVPILDAVLSARVRKIFDSCDKEFPCIAKNSASKTKAASNNSSQGCNNDPLEIKSIQSGACSVFGLDCEDAIPKLYLDLNLKATYPAIYRKASRLIFSFISKDSIICIVPSSNMSADKYSGCLNELHTSDSSSHGTSVDSK